SSDDDDDDDSAPSTSERKSIQVLPKKKELNVSFEDSSPELPRRLLTSSKLLKGSKSPTRTKNSPNKLKGSKLLKLKVKKETVNSDNEKKKLKFKKDLLKSCPVYRGEVRKYKAFRETFDDIVTVATDIKECLKMHLLLEKLKGE